MKILICKLCSGECEIVGNEFKVSKKIKCLKCGFTNLETVKEPEIFIIRKRS